MFYKYFPSLPLPHSLIIINMQNGADSVRHEEIVKWLEQLKIKDISMDKEGYQTRMFTVSLCVLIIQSVNMSRVH